MFKVTLKFKNERNVILPFDLMTIKYTNVTVFITVQGHALYKVHTDF